MSRYKNQVLITLYTETPTHPAIPVVTAQLQEKLGSMDEIDLWVERRDADRLDKPSERSWDHSWGDGDGLVATFQFTEVDLTHIEDEETFTKAFRQMLATRKACIEIIGSVIVNA